MLGVAACSSAGSRLKGKSVMYKQILSGTFVVALLLAAGLPVRSQTTEQAPPSTTQEQETPKAAEVSSEELEKFASAFKQIQTIQQDYQGRMVQAVEQQGLSQERYVQIQESQKNPSAQPNSEISQEDMQNYEQANATISQLQQEATSKMKEAVQAQGLDIERFNEIIAAIQQDPSLQEQVQQMIQN